MYYTITLSITTYFIQSQNEYFLINAPGFTFIRGGVFIRECSIPAPLSTGHGIPNHQIQLYPPWNA